MAIASAIISSGSAAIAAIIIPIRLALVASSGLTIISIHPWAAPAERCASGTLTAAYPPASLRIDRRALRLNGSAILRILRPVLGVLRILRPARLGVSGSMSLSRPVIHGSRAA